MAYSDDASRRVYARFYEYEGSIPAMDSFMRYVQRYGIPLAIYADKHSTYQSLAPSTVEEQLAGVTPTSQFGRALGELGVELIPAHSPQAKGRVERLFQTFQDRVIKEMRLADVSTLEAANQFLEGYRPAPPFVSPESECTGGRWIRNAFRSPTRSTVFVAIRGSRR